MKTIRTTRPCAGVILTLALLIACGRGEQDGSQGPGPGPIPPAPVHGWSAPVQVDRATQNTNSDATVALADGSVRVFWVQGDFAYVVMESVRDAATGIWSTPTVVGVPGSGYPSDVHASFNAQGRGILAWDDRDPAYNNPPTTLSYVLFDPATRTWGAASSLSQLVAPYWGFGDWDVALDTQGKALLTVYNANGFIALRGDPAANAWETPVCLSPDVALNPRILPLPANRALVVWERRGLGCSALTACLLDGSWGIPVDLETDSQDLFASMPAYAADPSGNAVVAWSQAEVAWSQAEGNFLHNASVLARRFDAVTATWGPAATLKASTPGAGNWISLSISPSGECFALWGYTSTFCRLESNRFASGAWQGAQLVQAATASGASSVWESHAGAIDAAGACMAVWTQGADNVFTGRYALAAPGSSWPAPVTFTNPLDHGRNIRCFSPSVGVWVRTWEQYGTDGFDHIWSSEYR